MHDGERIVAASIARAFDYSESMVLCQPSMASGKSHPPDIVLIDPETGVDVFEVKGCELCAIVSVNAGGEIAIRYASGVKLQSPIHQAHRAMFAVRDAMRTTLLREPTIRLHAWVVFPRITRAAWIEHLGGFCPCEFLFADDLSTRDLRKKIGATDRDDAAAQPILIQPTTELEALLGAFGDTSVFVLPDLRRPHRSAPLDSLGHQIDSGIDAIKFLSDEQQRLSEADWADGPRLVRGVAGSGKTIVLATAAARYLQRATRTQALLFPDPTALRPHEPRVLAVCFNRSLAPLLRDRISHAWRQRSDSPFPAANIEVTSFNRLLFLLSTRGLWTYRKVGDADERERSVDYLDALRKKRLLDPAAVDRQLFDAIFIDEGQDFLPEDYKLLLQLCRGSEAANADETARPNFFVFYDDAQNLYGRPRPNWLSLGLEIRGRATVMSRCFRNTRPIVEAATNVLYGTRAEEGARIPSRDFADLPTLVSRGLVKQDAGGLMRLRFAPRNGPFPSLSVFAGEEQELRAAAAHVKSLIVDHHVRPQDIFVLASKQQKIQQLVRLIEAMKLPGVRDIHLTFQRKDELLGLPERLTFSTIHSSKGHDAACVVLISANEISENVDGRSSFYVAATRATHRLDVFAYRATGLVAELQAVLMEMTE